MNDKNGYAFERALGIYTDLIKTPYGYIEKADSTTDIFIDMVDEDVLNALDIVQNHFKVNIFRAGHRIYIIPLEDSLLAVSESDVAKYFHITNKTTTRENYERLTLFYYITLIFLSEIYGGTPFRKLNDYSTIENLFDAIEKAIDRVSSYTKEDDVEFRFNISAIANKWSNFVLSVEDTNKDKVNSMSTKMGFLEKSINFLKNQGLVDVKKAEGVRIYPTIKLNDLVTHGGLNMDRIEELKIKVQNNVNNETRSLSSIGDINSIDEGEVR